LEIVNYWTSIEREGFSFILALCEWILFLESNWNSFLIEIAVLIQDWKL